MRENDAKIKALIALKQQRKAELMRQIRAVENELKGLIRQGQRDILAKRKERHHDDGSAWRLFLEQIATQPDIGQEACCWDIWDGQFMTGRAMDYWSEKWKKMLNFRS